MRPQEDFFNGLVAAFDPVWETRMPKEKARVVRMLVQQVDYDGSTGTVSLRRC